MSLTKLPWACYKDWLSLGPVGAGGMASGESENHGSVAIVDTGNIIAVS